jgi:N-acyl-D-amino-acid deacylase
VSAYDVLVRGAAWSTGPATPGSAPTWRCAPTGSPPSPHRVASRRALPPRWSTRASACCAPASSTSRATRSCPLMRDGRCLSKITQGVTTEIMGEAWTPAPLGGLIEDPMSRTMFALDVDPSGSSGCAVVAALRRLAGRDGGDRRQPQRRLVPGWRHAAELRQGHGDGAGRRGRARDHAARARRRDGGRRLRRVVRADLPARRVRRHARARRGLPRHGAHGGVYITHLRSESGGIFEALDEAFTIGREAGVPVEVYHLKAVASRRTGGACPR